MIEIRNTRAGRCPVMLCDVCGKLIRETGNVLYPDGDGPVRFVHKDCDDGSHCDGWEELDVFLFQLVYNAGADLNRGKKHTEIFEALGGE